ncbi:Myb-like DNA-binding domain-containing protein [Spironucleus salmonicida]|uniref:Myb-like DNA-binding domain-containing protein n=1 Tax=Spironucleus salmonicida TaxID=348837 RepID=V6LMF0_9EUKA|nr:Myb-like DNA-binding domain-containing protein [Spironucleus salmonicida]|eukprot:EST45872.1 Myb-like DNA-binding domain-containing protein [Spironucleus salmonicida]
MHDISWSVEDMFYLLLSVEQFGTNWNTIKNEIFPFREVKQLSYKYQNLIRERCHKEEQAMIMYQRRRRLLRKIKRGIFAQ